jgi:hypothetical protein
MKHLASHASDMFAAWIIAMPVVIIALLCGGWLIGHGIVGIEHALDALQNAVIG